MFNTIDSELILETERVIMRPVAPQDFDRFYELAQDEDSWKYFTLNLADRDHLEKWMAMGEADKQAGTRRPFTIIDKQTNKIAGGTSIGNIAFHDLRFEIGWSWLGKDFRSSGVNRHCKYAMMRFGFEQLGFERVEFKTDVLNERAKQGLRKIGGIEEGVLRSHMTMWNDRRRSSVYFSVLKNEWPVLKETIFTDIEGYGFH